MNNLNETQNLNYEQKKNNGKGVFYGVIAVATLIVAIIGATFAYFTASANSSNEALRATAAHVEVNYLEGRQLVATNLIPSKADVVALAYARPTAYETNLKNGCTHKTDNDSKEKNPESMTDGNNWTCDTYKVVGELSGHKVGEILTSEQYNALNLQTDEEKAKVSKVSPVSTGDVGTKCVDDNGYYVCAVYQFTVTNTSNVKQALQAYMTINSNEFTTVDNAAATTKEGLKTDHSNGALKFMTVRSGSIINVNAVSSESYNETTNPICQNDLYNGVVQSVKSTKFCVPSGSSSWTADVNSEGTELAEDHGIITDTSGSYYFYNTTAVRQSLLATGNQTVFNGEILPSISAANLTSANGILYMHTVSQGTNDVSKVGPLDNSKPVGEKYADTNGYVYNDVATCMNNKTYNASCYKIYLSSSKVPTGSAIVNKNGVDTSEPESDTVLGAYGQVSRTYYIVAWLEENNPTNSLKFYSGAISPDENKPSHNKKVDEDDLDQDDDQDASFATTIYVTSGAADESSVPGITGTIN